jgi:hypothetical protein
MNTLTRSGIKYAVEYPDADYTEVVDWCRENFGEPNIINGRWFALEYTIQFATRRDRDWFYLRWGNNARI